MSYYENNFIEQNNVEYNNLEEGYDNGDNFYYLTENEQAVTGLDDNIYEEDNYVEHMQPQRQEQVIQQVAPLAPVAVVAPLVKDKKVKKEKAKAKAKLDWLYVLVIILIIALVAYYLIDKKIITLPSFGSSGSTSSPSASSSSSFKSTLGSTFMSLH